MTTPTTPEQSVDELAKDSALSMWKSYCAKKEQCEDLAEQVEALTAERDGLTQAVIDRDSITRGLLERIDALKPDAELYRHLRDHFAKTAKDAKSEFARLEPLTGAQFDAVVRASIDAMGVEA